MIRRYCISQECDTIAPPSYLPLHQPLKVQTRQLMIDQLEQKPPSQEVAAAGLHIHTYRACSMPFLDRQLGQEFRPWNAQ